MVMPLGIVYRVVFDTPTARQAAQRALIYFAHETSAAVIGPDRIVIWDEHRGAESCAMFVSRGGLAALELILNIQLKGSHALAPDELPRDRRLVFGHPVDEAR
jgi:hypothetical protein